MAKKDRPESASVEVEVKHPGLRFLAIGVLIAIALAAFGTGLMGLLEGDGDGWKEMTVDPASKSNCGEDFRLLVDYSRLSTADRKALSLTYTQASEEAFALFHAGQHFDSTVNLYDLSAHPGETLTLPPALYHALELVQQSGQPWLTLAPVYETYQSLFLAENDREALDASPRRSQEVAAYVRQALTYCTDPAHVRLELLGENRARLTVSAEYAAFAQENGQTAYLDFFWMKNAFITDYLADALLEKGFTRAVLTSKDGFGACLDSSGESYTLNFYHREGNSQVLAAAVGYDRPTRMVTFRDTPLTDLPMQDLYYTWEDGEVTAPYLSPADGLDHCALPEVTAGSASRSCGEMVLALAPLYIRDAWDLAAAADLTAQGIWTVTWQNGRPTLSDPTAVQLLLPEE